MKQPIAANDNWPLVLTRQQCADMCRISTSTFDAWVRKKILPGPIRGTRRWSRIAIEHALAGEAATAEPLRSPFEQWSRASAG
jgi:predicted DNA-binding transcriptional regulator AlpA